MHKPFSAHLDINWILRSRSRRCADNVVAKVEVQIDGTKTLTGDAIEPVVVLAASNLRVAGGRKLHFSGKRDRRNIFLLLNYEIGQGGFEIAHAGCRPAARRLNRCEGDRLN